MTYTWDLACSHTICLHECMQYVEEKIAIQVLLKTEDKKRAVKKVPVERCVYGAVCLA